MQIKACRLCGKKRLTSLFSLGDHYVNTFPEAWPYDGAKCPIEIVKCEACGLVQQKYSAPSDLLYSRHYWYKSGINETISQDLKNIAQLAKTYMKKGETILDIGANDGTLLSFVGDKYHRVGVEPASNLTEELQKNCDECVADFWTGYPKKAKVITAIGMFYDLEDPIKFVTDIKDSLEDDGVFIAQLMTAKQMHEKNDVGNLCHEHLEFYDYKTLVYLFEQSGLEIFKVEENDINGGSYRLFARHLKDGSIEYPEDDLDWEMFYNNIDTQRKLMRMYVAAAKAGGQRIYGYGASTKGNTILQFYDILLDGVADRNPEKIGRFMLNGTPIVSEEEAREKTKFFWAFPYGFIDSFIKREHEWINNGGLFITSIPHFDVFPKK